MKRWELEGGGTLSMVEDGPRVVLEGRRPEDKRGLYKLWVRGGHGGRYLLGTLVPEQGALRIRRTLSRQTLEGAGCWPLSGGEAVLAYSFGDSPRGGGWSREGQPARLLPDQVLRESAGQWGPMLCRREGEAFFLAAPFSVDRPLPLTALFCLGRLEPIQGAPHIVWKFNAQGIPQIPNKTGGGRTS